MYKLQIKAALISAKFLPANGWAVCVNIDGSEKGLKDAKKRACVEPAERIIRSAKVRVGRHSVFGAKDIVAEHPQLGTIVLKAIGLSSEQPEQELYNALGQLILSMDQLNGSVTFVVAAPDEPKWVERMERVPRSVRQALHLELWAVANAGFRVIP